MDRTIGRKVFSRGPLRSIHFWLSTVFLAGISCLAIGIVAWHSDRFSPGALQWLLMGIAAVWTYWIKVLIAHITLQRCMGAANTEDDTDLILKQAAELAYNGLGFAGFAIMALLFALWRVVAMR